MHSKRLFDRIDSLQSDVKQISDTHSLMTLFDNKQLYKNLKIARNAIRIGRPLGTSVVFVTGLANSGKSSLINCLLRDQEQKPAIESNKEFIYRRVTQDVNAQFNGFSLCGSIVMIDAPGFLENNQMEAAIHIASIRSLRQSLLEIQERNLEAKTFKCIPGSEVVYPNVVVFAIRATENRLLNNSCLRNSLVALKRVPNLIDVERKNLLIVITNCVALGKDRDIFEAHLKVKQSVIQKVVRNVFEFDVNIIPLENCGEDYDLRSSDGFFVLPNEEVSHKNLLISIESLCRANEDLVGHCIIKDFAKFNENPVSSKNVAYSINREDILEGYQFLAKVNNHGDVNAFSLGFFGRGYSPVTEKVVTGSLLTQYAIKDGQDLPPNLKVVDIEGFKWLVPEYCVLQPKNDEDGIRITRADKSMHEKFITEEFLKDLLLDGQQLNVKVTIEDRWLSVAEKAKNAIGFLSVVKYVYHINRVKLCADLKACKLSFQLIDDINALPRYSNKNDSKHAYESFFERWGTHIVNEINLGGYIESKFSIRSCGALYNPSMSLWDSDARKYLHSRIHERRSKLPTEVSFKLNGDLEPTDAAHISSWKDNLSTKMVELKYTMKLYPYYKLCGGQKSKDLKSATFNYLTGGGKFDVHTQPHRERFLNASEGANF